MKKVILFSGSTDGRPLRFSLLTFSLLVWIILIIATTSVEPVNNDVIKDAEVVCINQTTCGACISASPICSWCSNSAFTKIRCDSRKILLANGCPDSEIANPKTKLNIMEDKPTSDGLTAVQITPQKVQLQIRPHVSVEVPFQFYLAQDYAVDMYFLMDLSNTMKVHIEQLAQVSKDLVDDIRNLTKSLQVGIGAFVDKNVMPYTMQESPPAEKYDFKQMTKLTNKFTDFQTMIDKLKDSTTENLDAPEAGLDAVMQSIMCEQQIGWRKNSRRLIIYSSDAPFHFGGDGKLGGIMIPNDGACHLRENKYTKGRQQDYPSVGQMVNTIQENHITVIFAVSGARLKTYQNFVKNIRGAYVSELNSQTATIAEIVKERYKNISSRVEMTADNKDMKITFMSKCSGSNWTYTKYCDNLKPRQTVSFKALIPPQTCPPGKHKVIKNIDILPIGLKQKFQIQLELICGCECEKNTQAMSHSCGRIGNLTCGKCYCNNLVLFEKCQLYNTTTECSDRGSCECGKCFCNKVPNSQNYYYGKFCECSDYSCPNFNGTLCGGPTHGKCLCNKCECRPEFEGNDCSCPIDKSTCFAKNKKICNGYGKCICGECQCDIDSGYKGKTCENCPTCGKCGKFEECVKCVLSQEDQSSKNCTKPCYDAKVEIVEKLDDKKQSYDDKEVCMVEINDCIVSYRNGIEKLAILKKQDCKKEINLVALIAGIIGGIFLVGILLLVLWKVITTLQDRRELARFNEERENAKWTAHSNPLFVEASTTFRNPMWNSNPEL